MTRVLVVTPWGDPSNWSRATYRIPTIINEFKFRGRVEREFIDSGTHYRSVLGALLESLTTKSINRLPGIPRELLRYCISRTTYQYAGV
ncbi:MAG: hypothetical protein N3E36_07415 [Sulfolobales archaeon]|nr:hypothetical protein [Sulfolobales archaeon]